MTAADGFGIAGVGIAFVIVLVAVGAAVVAIVRDMNKPLQDEEAAKEEGAVE